MDGTTVETLKIFLGEALILIMSIFIIVIFPRIRQRLSEASSKDDKSLIKAITDVLFGSKKDNSKDKKDR